MTDGQRAAEALQRAGELLPQSFLAGVVVGALCLLLALWLLRPLAWKLFSFDRRIRAVRAQQKSSEVRLGLLTETLAPLAEAFPVEVGREGTSTVFLGQPVDYVHFDPEEGVTFIEVKSGVSKLSPKQAALRRRVERGDVFWETLRIDGATDER
ncbi:MAG: Holliday junction resolvase-like protein [Acidobacteriota bacterium]